MAKYIDECDLDDGEVSLTPREANPCPFCGYQPTIQFWSGGLPTRTLIGCPGTDCYPSPSVVGETRHEALVMWNMREGAQ